MEVLSDLLKSGNSAFTSGGAVDRFQQELQADVQLGANNTFVNGPSMDLPAGTWLVLGQAQYQRTATTSAQVTARLRSGTTTISTQNADHPSLAGSTLAFTLFAIVTLAATTTVTLQMATTAGSTSSLLKAVSPNNGGGNTATRLVAIRLG